MERESAARRVQSGGKGEVVIPYPKEEICGEEQGATNEECLPSAQPVGWARGALGVHSSSSVHHESPFCADSTYPRGLYRISNRGQRLYQTRVGSGSCSGGSVNEIRRMPQQFAISACINLVTPLQRSAGHRRRDDEHHMWPLPSPYPLPGQTGRGIGKGHREGTKEKESKNSQTP